MDTHVTNGPSNSHYCSSENAEINIDTIVAAVAKLNVRILRLREEIVAFKNENASSSVLTHNSLSLTPAEFNHSTKNGENRTGARHETRRNFKRDDSPSGTDLSARLSFAKRAREVKAANEAAVFKEDYPRDDKSIEDDERPNRSRVSEPSGTYRKSISDAEKSGKETYEGPESVRDATDARTSGVADEKLRNEHQNEEIVSETGCSPTNIFTSKIRRKRISRGVQCASTRCRGHAGRFLFNCFKSESRRRSLARKTKRRKPNKFHESRNEVNGLRGTTIINDESLNGIKEEIKSTGDVDSKREKCEEIGEEKIERITYEKDKEPFVRMQDMRDSEKSKDNDDSKYCKVKVNLLDKLRLNRTLTSKNNSKAQENGSRHEPRYDKEELARLAYEGKRVNNAHKHEDKLQSIKIVDRQTTNPSNVDRRSDVNKIKARLDSCIADLNGIIGDVCAIFGNRRNAKEE